MVVDGLHRLSKAVQNGVKRLPGRMVLASVMQTARV